jgi:hypothetical protein
VADPRFFALRLGNRKIALFLLQFRIFVADLGPDLGQSDSETRPFGFGASGSGAHCSATRLYALLGTSGFAFRNIAAHQSSFEIDFLSGLEFLKI